MNLILYIIIFIMGTVFGSFYTLAIYRIPKKIDIIRLHSFCPNCGHKLGFFELIPILSYIFLGGKCKECKQNIRPRYLILEILSGLAFVLIALGLKINANHLDINAIIRFGFIVLYMVGIFIIAGIDKEDRKIEKNVLYYAVFVSCAYIIYLCIIDRASIYRYVMYLITLIILLSLDTIMQRNQAKESYLISTLILIVVMLINTGVFITSLSIISIVFAIIIGRCICHLKNALNKSKKENLQNIESYKFGYLFGVINILLLMGSLII